MHNSIKGFAAVVQFSFNHWFETPSRRIEELAVDEDLFVYHHLGLGDMIHCNGMIRYLLDRLNADRNVHVFCKARNLGMTKWMYKDESRIRLVPIADGERESPVVQRTLKNHRSRNFLSVGHRALRNLERVYPQAFYDELFYRQVGLPYSIRYDWCYWKRDLAEEERVYQKLAPASPYAFVHDDASRGFSIDTSTIGMAVVRNDITESIFHMGLLLERAAEVHCMESSIRCMLESLDMSNCKLYYHNFRYPDRPLDNATRQSWTSIDRWETNRNGMIATK